MILTLERIHGTMTNNLESNDAVYGSYDLTHRSSHSEPLRKFLQSLRGVRTYVIEDDGTRIPAPRDLDTRGVLVMGRPISDTDCERLLTNQ